MPRPLRLDHPDARHHVMNRGARHEPIFRDDQDCVAFLDLLARCTDLFALRVHAYALMGNHFHLMVSTPRGNLPEAMSFLQSRFARRQNRNHQWDGPIFRGRYRNRLVEDEAYWRHLLAYVHLNPVAAHLVGEPEHAVWTSHRAYLGLEPRPPWLDTAELLDLFGGAEALRDYVYEVQVGRRHAPEGFDPERLWRRAASQTGPLPVEAPPKRAEAALAEVCAVTGLTLGAVEAATRGPGGNRARLLAMWWLHEGAGLGTNAIARRYHMDPAATSRLLKRARLAQDPEFEAWKAALLEGASAAAQVSTVHRWH